MKIPMILAHVRISSGVQAVLNTATMPISAPVETYRFVDAFIVNPIQSLVMAAT